MRVLSVIGNRPQFIKAAAVSRRLRATHDEVLVHTGQHFDHQLSDVFFRELDLPAPEHHLACGGGTNTAQTARMLAALEPLIEVERPDAVLVYGDTNSTLAGGVAAAQAGVPVAHVEAGMRSYDRTMPEELNRVLVDHAASLLLCSSDSAARNLARENVSGSVEVVGDVMVDVAELVQPRARARTDVFETFHVKRSEYVLVTAHRVATVDDPARLERLVALLERLPLPAVFPLHPRTAARLEAAGLRARLGAAVTLTEPLGYLDFTTLLVGARALVTDSGGAQKEAYLAGVPCVTLRDRTEWTETVEVGWNTLVDLDAAAAAAAVVSRPPAARPPLYGDGRAGARVVTALEQTFG